VDGEGPVPLEELQNQKYREVMSIRLYYDWSTYGISIKSTTLTDGILSFRDTLMEECIRMMQQSLREAPTLRKKAKTVYNQRNLGTIRQKKREKKQAKDVSNGDVILRILRMRYVLFPQRCSDRRLAHCGIIQGLIRPILLVSSYRL
jgi:hypothetical protein